jgi:hypothetical protein
MWLVVGLGLKRFITQKLKGLPPGSGAFHPNAKENYTYLRQWAAAPSERRGREPATTFAQWRVLPLVPRSLTEPLGCRPFWTAEPKATGEVVSVALLLTHDWSGAGRTMQQRLHWLDYDPVALAVLVFGMGMIALLALSIWALPEPRHARCMVCRHQLNVLSRKLRSCAALQPGSTARLFVIFSTAWIRQRIHLPQVTAAQKLQIKAEARLASLIEEKLVTRISVLSTLLGGGKTTERLLVRISIETHKTSPDFDQTAADKAKNRIKQALGEIGCDVFIETDR